MSFQFLFLFCMSVFFRIGILIAIVSSRIFFPVDFIQHWRRIIKTKEAIYADTDGTSRYIRNLGGFAVSQSLELSDGETNLYTRLTQAFLAGSSLAGSVYGSGI